MHTNKEIVLEYKDKTNKDKGILVNDCVDKAWIIDFTNHTIIDLDTNKAILVILEEIDFTVGINYKEWFYKTLIEYCINEIQDTDSQKMKEILKEIKQC